jgi:hypothetical protein
MRNGQSGRRRGRGGVRSSPVNTNRNGGGDLGNRIEVRARGNAHQLLEKFKSMARDATTQGDRVTAEYYMQYADHYHRVLNDHRGRQDEPRARYREDEQRDDYPADEARAASEGDRESRDFERDQDQLPIDAGSEVGEAPSRGVEERQSARRGRGRRVAPPVEAEEMHRPAFLSQSATDNSDAASESSVQAEPASAGRTSRRRAARVETEGDSADAKAEPAAPPRRRRAARPRSEEPEGGAELELVDA